MEQAEFTKALLMRGVPLNPKTGEYDWELFRLRLGSARSSAELSTYYNTFLAFCRELVVRHGTAAEPKAEAPVKEQGISFETAKSIVLRLMFFFALRSAILPNPYLDHFLRSAPRPAAMFPNWWTPDYDKALLIGVEHYGLEDTEGICSDPQLPFKAVVASVAETSAPAAANTSPRPSERLSFPPRAEVLRRVELLCKHVQLCSLHSSSPGSGGSPPSFALTTPPPPPSMPSPASRPVSQSPSSAHMPPPTLPTRKEKRSSAAAHTTKDETKHQRTDA